MVGAAVPELAKLVDDWRDDSLRTRSPGNRKLARANNSRALWGGSVETRSGFMFLSRTCLFEVFVGFLGRLVFLGGEQ